MPFDHFNLIARVYNQAAKFEASPHLLEILSVPNEGLVLDAGGGTGRVLEAFKQIGQKGIIADPSMGMIRQAVQKGLLCVCTPAENLPFAPLSFSTIIMMDALHHVRDQEGTIRELWRVLQQGGKMVIIEPDIRKMSIKLIALAEKLLLMRSHFLSGKKISQLFVKLNADTREIIDGNNVWILTEKER